MSKAAPRYATIKTTATYAATSTNTVRRWIQRGDISSFGYGTRFVRVDLNEVDAMLRGEHVKAVA